MDEIGIERVDEEIAVGGAEGEGAEIVEDEPLDGRDLAFLGGGDGGTDLDRARERDRLRLGFVPGEDEDERREGKSERVGVESGEEGGVLDEPSFLARAHLFELVAGDAAHFPQMGSSRHCFLLPPLLSIIITWSDHNNTGTDDVRESRFGEEDALSTPFSFGERCQGGKGPVK